MPEPQKLTQEVTRNEGEAVAKKDSTQTRQAPSAALIPEGKETTVQADLDQTDQRQRTHQERTTGNTPQPTTQESQW